MSASLVFASIDINYGVKSCDASVPVRVELSLTENTLTGGTFYLDENAAQKGKISIGGVKVNTSYIAKVKVFNASTNELIETKQIFAAAVRKAGV